MKRQLPHGPECVLPAAWRGLCGNDQLLEDMKQSGFEAVVLNVPKTQLSEKCEVGETRDGKSASNCMGGSSHGVCLISL